MEGYIFRRCILVAFIIMSLVFGWSLLGPTEYHFTHYHDVHIISEKKEMVTNPDCNNKNHSHYMIQQITVEWKGTNSKGEIKKFTTNFDDEGDSDDGITYQDLHNGVAKTHNCMKSLLTWFGFIIISVLFIFGYLTEDFEDDYSWSEQEDVKKLQINIWGKFARFWGYKPEIIEKVKEYYYNTRNRNIPNYRQMFSKYKEFKNFSTLEVSTNEK